MMEATGVLPTWTEEADVSLIPKPGAKRLAYADLRPISVAATLWRVYGAHRLTSVGFPWLENLSRHPEIGALPLSGCRKHSSTRDLTLPSSFMVERSICEHESIYGVSYDAAKAFDRLPVRIHSEAGLDLPSADDPRWGLAWRVLCKLGFPRVLVRLVHSFYFGLRRRFKRFGLLGHTVHPQQLRAALQGCSFSMIIMNAMPASWHLVVRNGIPGQQFSRLEAHFQHHLGWDARVSGAMKQLVSRELTPQQRGNLRLGSYMDDPHCIATQASLIKRVHGVTLVWVASSGGVVNFSKSAVLVPKGHRIHLHVGGDATPSVQALWVLGEFLGLSARKRGLGLHTAVHQCPDKRVNECTKRLRQIAFPPGDQSRRADLIAISAIPSLYMGPISIVPQAACAKLRVEV